MGYNISRSFDFNNITYSNIFFIYLKSLCKVALETTTPPILTGSIFATGVSAIYSFNYEFQY